MKIDTIRIAGRIASLPTALLTATLAFTAFGQQGGSGSGFSGDELKALPTDGWITNGGNIYNQRYSPLTDITPENIGELNGVWRARLEGSAVGSKYSGEATLIVHDGVIYTVPGPGEFGHDTWAQDNEVWRYGGATVWQTPAVDPDLDL